MLGSAFPSSWRLAEGWLPEVCLGKDQSALEAFIRKCRFLGPILVLLNLMLWSVAQESEYLTDCLVPPLHAQVWKALWPSAALVFRQSDHDGCYHDLRPALGFPTQWLRSKQPVQKTVLARLLNQVSASVSRHFFCIMGQSQVLFCPLPFTQTLATRERHQKMKDIITTQNKLWVPARPLGFHFSPNSSSVELLPSGYILPSRTNSQPPFLTSFPF